MSASFPQKIKMSTLQVKKCPLVLLFHVFEANMNTWLSLFFFQWKMRRHMITTLGHL